MTSERRPTSRQAASDLASNNILPQQHNPLSMLRFLFRICFVVALIAPSVSADAWRKLPFTLPSPQGSVTTTIANNNILLLVGEDNPSTFAYLLLGNIWLAPRSPRPFFGAHHAGVRSTRGVWFLFGGIGGGSEGQIQSYSFAQDTWTIHPPIPWNAGGALCVASIEETVYVCGGTDSTNTVSLTTCGILSLSSWTWTNMSDMPFGVNYAATATDGLKVYVAGGRGGGDWVSPGYDLLQVYDISSDTWTSSDDGYSFLSPLPVGRGGMGPGIIVQGLLYIMGGETSLTPPDGPANGVYNRIDIYSIENNTWTSGPDMPVALHGIYPTLYGSASILVFGGDVTQGQSPTNTMLALDVCSVYTWTATPCSVSCGLGQHILTGTSAPSCPTVKKVATCMLQPSCCTPTAWTAWTSCSSLCDRGVRTSWRLVGPAASTVTPDSQKTATTTTTSTTKTTTTTSRIATTTTTTKTTTTTTSSKSAHHSFIQPLDDAGARPGPILFTPPTTPAFDMAISSCVNMTRTTPCDSTNTCADNGCVFSAWTSWSECTTTCGTSGFQHRSRTLIQRGSADCAPLSQRQQCASVPCPFNCAALAWSAWTSCSATCDTGTRVRRRNISQSSLSTASECGRSIQSSLCAGPPCPCQVSVWDAWSGCPVCGASYRARTRTVVRPASPGGEPCPRLTEIGICPACPESSTTKKPLVTTAPLLTSTHSHTNLTATTTITSRFNSTTTRITKTTMAPHSPLSTHTTINANHTTHIVVNTTHTTAADTHFNSSSTMVGTLIISTPTPVVTTSNITTTTNTTHFTSTSSPFKTTSTATRTPNGINISTVPVFLTTIPPSNHTTVSNSSVTSTPTIGNISTTSATNTTVSMESANVTTVPVSIATLAPAMTLNSSSETTSTLTTTSLPNISTTALFNSSVPTDLNSTTPSTTNTTTIPPTSLNSTLTVTAPLFATTLSSTTQSTIESTPNSTAAAAAITTTPATATTTANH